MGEYIVDMHLKNDGLALSVDLKKSVGEVYLLCFLQLEGLFLSFWSKNEIKISLLGQFKQTNQKWKSDIWMVCHPGR